MIVYLLPFVFIVHDFEEIIGYKSWFNRHGYWLGLKFPFLKRIITHFESLPTSAFALGVLEEFLIISLVTIHSLLFHWYYAWIAVFTAFAFHIMIHLIQWLIVRKYIPVVITSVLSLPYILWGIKWILISFPLTEVLICFLIGLFVMVINLFIVHKFITKFHSNKPKEERV